MRREWSRCDASAVDSWKMTELSSEGFTQGQKERYLLPIPGIF